MGNLFNTLIERKSELLIALYEHLEISLIALFFAILIGVSLALLISKYNKITTVLLQITGIFQTIPSLAILGLLIPIFGIGKLPAILTLILYAVFPILQNTITGLNEIDNSIKEAAEAFGMTKWEKIRKFELALAMPVIISGIRTSTVMIIGTATLAALIGAGGLGSFILLGIDRNNSDLIIIGAISSAILAILFNSGIAFLEKFSFKKVLLIFALIFSSFFISISPKMMMDNKTIVVAGKLGVEPEIIINIYKELIEHYTDIKVELKPNFGKTTFLHKALISGDIDIYPEYSGTILFSLVFTDKISNDSIEVYKIAKELIYKQDKLVYLPTMDFQNTYALAMKMEDAKKYNIEKISDLKNIENKIKTGFTLEFNDREDGNKGLKRLYNLNLEVITVEPSLRYKAIKNNEIQLIDAYSTDSEIKEYGLVLLKDNLRLFPPYQVGPLVREEVLAKYPEIQNVLENLNGILTTEEMIEMNYNVRVNNKMPNEVAKEFLKLKGLI